MSRWVIFGASLVALIVSGCGLKYDLYLPEDEAQAIEQNQGGTMGSDTTTQD